MNQQKMRLNADSLSSWSCLDFLAHNVSMFIHKQWRECLCTRYMDQLKKDACEEVRYHGKIEGLGV